MGCDIHVHVEVKFYDTWMYYNHPSVDRGYALFGILAGVRSDTDPIIPIKGLPDDITPMTQIHWDRECDDAHHATYFNLDDFAIMRQEVELTFDIDLDEKFGYVFGNSFDCFRDDPHSCPKGMTDVRVIFWFDN